MNLIIKQISYRLAQEENFLTNLWLDNNDISMYSTHNEDNSLV